MPASTQSAALGILFQILTLPNKLILLFSFLKDEKLNWDTVSDFTQCDTADVTLS